MKRHKKNFYIILFLIVLFSISFGYAVLNRTLNITGNSEVKQNTWDIHFDNVNITSGGVTAIKEPIIDNTNLAIDFEFMLNLPGDFYEFTVDVVNSGTIDAMIDSVIKTPELTDDQKKYMNYIIEYQNGEKISSKQLVQAGEFVRLKVRVEFRSDVAEEDIPTSNLTFDLGFDLNFVQSDNMAIYVKDNGLWSVTANGSLDEIGTVVTIGSEKFYTIGTEGEDVKLLSMYNLNIGRDCILGDDNFLKCVTYYDTASGIQGSDIIGWTSDDSEKRKGVIFFANEEKWTHKFDSYPAFAYNSDTLLFSHIEKYKTYLETFKVNVKEARILNYEELISLDCDLEGKNCASSPSFVYSTSYWTGAATDSKHVYRILSDNTIESKHIEISSGVRPVIVIPKSDIAIRPSANGNIEDIGTIVTIGTEQFYTIGTNRNNVKLLSMYNLYVGNECTYDGTSLCTPYGGEADGLQDENMRGYVDDRISRNGTTVFSSEFKKGLNYSDYEGSIVEEYVNNYKIEIERMGVNIEEARLITKDELTSEEIGCSISNSSCSNAPSFIYATSYWSSSANDFEHVWRVDGIGRFVYSKYSLNDYVGVRPVIVIPKSYF